MTTYYVGSGGNNSNDGLSWANRKLTLNGVEDIPVAAGDVCYVAPGVYRETLTCDVSGSAGSPITYIGDYAGSVTDGVGGVVRITGSDDDVTATRANCIAASSKNYRTFRGFDFQLTTQAVINIATCTDWSIDQCAFSPWTLTNNTSTILSSGATQARVIITNCTFGPFLGAYTIHFSHSSAVDNAGHAVENCIFDGYARCIQSSKVGGITVRNCLFRNASFGVIVASALTSGQTVTVNNCVFLACNVALYGINAGEVVENYNAISACATPRTNTNTGENSNTLPPLFDTRWFFELVAGGNMLSPFDLASYSPLINVAGTSPTTTDMRGTSVQGAQREWGALEHDPALLIEEGAGGGGGGPVVGSRIIRGLGAI